ncbi:hypothetical protein EVAR_25179_1 [Eumeta japonica]|uniref:Uncharacterized protein n=1 Tax=Eumeta variegata TaxID=151549 RepID=A0A4C1VRP7_EUMVA|nr:hypothetical protein EVAR_25179_1 [Eumeta japonica]
MWYVLSASSARIVLHVTIRRALREVAPLRGVHPTSIMLPKKKKRRKTYYVLTVVAVLGFKMKSSMLDQCGLRATNCRRHLHVKYARDRRLKDITYPENEPV